MTAIDRDHRLIALARQEEILDWRLLDYGVRQHFIGPSAVVEEADRIAKEVDSPSPGLIRLLGAGPTDEEEIRAAAFELASETPGRTDEHLRTVWRYLLLRDLRASEPDFEKVLAGVAVLFRDFGYPPDMRDAVSYMMPSGGERAVVGTRLRSPIDALDDLLKTLRQQIVTNGG